MYRIVQYVEGQLFLWTERYGFLAVSSSSKIKRGWGRTMFPTRSEAEGFRDLIDNGYFVGQSTIEKKEHGQWVNILQH
jgi:hypothetical protein